MDKLDSVLDDIRKLKAQRDELLEACIKALDALIDAEAIGYFDLGITEKIIETFEQLPAIIERITNNE
jgi:hypothetical protein